MCNTLDMQTPLVVAMRIVNSRAFWPTSATMQGWRYRHSKRAASESTSCRAGKKTVLFRRRPITL